MIRVLSRDPERSMLGFSREVAKLVTQPLWPLRVPLRINCSAIGAVLGSMRRVRRVRMEKFRVEDSFCSVKTYGPVKSA